MTDDKELKIVDPLPQVEIQNWMMDIQELVPLIVAYSMAPSTELRDKICDHLECAMRTLRLIKQAFDPSRLDVCYPCFMDGELQTVKISEDGAADWCMARTSRRDGKLYTYGCIELTE